MGLRQRFWRDERGTTFEGIALSVAIVAVAFVASADMLDYVVKTRHAPPPVEFAAAPHASSQLIGRANRDPNVDYTATASLPTRSVTTMISRSVLDPCTAPSR